MSNLIVIAPEALDRIEAALTRAARELGAATLMMVDKTGAVLALSGDPPLHPDQMGGLVAGLFGAMSALVKATRAEEFAVSLPRQGMGLYFRQVDARLMLCAFLTGSISNEKLVPSHLERLAEESRHVIAETQPDMERRVGELGSFIDAKLNEIFSEINKLGNDDGSAATHPG